MAQQYPFVYYTPKDGLVNSRVRSIRQDSKGRMYFLTRGGLSVYDGKRFLNYHTQDGLANELVNDIVEVGPDSFLLATNISSLNTYVRGLVGKFKTPDNFCPVINSFFKSSDGYLYAAADEGLFKLEKDRFIKLSVKDGQGNDIGCCLDRIIEWKNYLILTPWNTELKEKMILYDRLRGAVTDIETNLQIGSSNAFLKGQPWISTAKGLRLIDTAALSKGKIKLPPIPAQYRDVVVEKDMLLVFDSNERAWFCHGTAIDIFSSAQKQTIKLGQGEKNYTFTNLFVDREGTMWLATDGDGIIKLRNTHIELINHINQQRLSCQGITRQSDTIWFNNLSDNSIYRFANGNFTRFPLSVKTGPCNLIAWNDRLYQLTPEKITCIENKDEPGSYQHPKLILQAGENMRFGQAVIDKNGAIIQYGLEDLSNYRLHVIVNGRIVSTNSISNAADQMCFDNKGRLWLTTRDHRLWAFTMHAGEPGKYLQLVAGYPKQLANIGPRSLTVDAAGHVWIGTRYEGIYQFLAKDTQLLPVAHFTTEHGLTDNFVSCLEHDDDNAIWAGTQTGIDKIYRKNDKYIFGNISRSNNFFQSIYKIIISDDKTIWALTQEGILKIALPHMPAMTNNSPAILLTALQVNNRPYHDTLRKFPYDQNNLLFSVAAPSYIDESSIQYSFLLQGSGNNNWSIPSNNANFNFVNLTHGNYVLKVRCQFPEMIYPMQEMSLAFSILPPWWQTWWFRSGMGLSALALLVLLTRSYYRRKLEKQKNILEKKRAIEKERTRIATDMHDELGAGLSRIKFLSETIGIKKQKQEAVEEDIDKIRQYAHDMIDKMGEIVWALNEKNDSLNDLLAYTREYAVQYLSENGIACTVDTPSQLPSLAISGEFRRNVYLTVKEALHNIVKHAQARHVHIDIQARNDLQFSISDDGTGFDENAVRPYGNGLANMKKRIESISGQLHFNNGKGTTLVFSVPLN